MAIIQLTKAERRQLREIVRSTRDAKELRRAQALLDLDRGERVEVAAERRKHVNVWPEKWAYSAHFRVAV